MLWLVGRVQFYIVRCHVGSYIMVVIVDLRSGRMMSMRVLGIRHAHQRNLGVRL